MLIWTHYPRFFEDLQAWKASGRDRSYLILYADDEPEVGYAWSYKIGDSSAVTDPRPYTELAQAKADCEIMEAKIRAA